MKVWEGIGEGKGYLKDGMDFEGVDWWGLFSVRTTIYSSA